METPPTRKKEVMSDVFTPFGSRWGKIQDGKVLAAMIASGAVTEAKLGTGAVTAGKIGTGAVTEAKIGAGAVTATKIASGAFRRYVFTGAAAAGACTLTGAKVGDVVVGVVNLTDVATATANFEATITVADQIQQSSASDLSEKKFDVILIAKGG